MMGQEADARCQLPNVRSQGVDEQIEKQGGENSPLSDPTVLPWSGERCTNSNLRLSVTEEMAHEMPHLPCHLHLMNADQSALNPRCVKRFLEVHKGNECESRWGELTSTSAPDRNPPWQTSRWEEMSGPMRKWTRCSKCFKQHDAREMGR